jgi:hypothetical protein
MMFALCRVEALPDDFTARSVPADVLMRFRAGSLKRAPQQRPPAPIRSHWISPPHLREQSVIFLTSSPCRGAHLAPGKQSRKPQLSPSISGGEKVIGLNH